MCGHRSERWTKFGEFYIVIDDDKVGFKDKPSCPGCKSPMLFDPEKIRIADVPDGDLMVW